MTRTIKFRAWNPNNPNLNQRMVKDPLHRCDPHDLLDGKTEGFYKDWVLMQYTGLKDKNGKEIYEGDVVERKGGWNYPTLHLEVIWNDKNACFQVGDWLIGHMQDPIEVIGNIYENPELVDKK